MGSHTIVNSIWDAFAYITQLEDLQIANNGERSFERRRMAEKSRLQDQLDRTVS